MKLVGPQPTLLATYLNTFSPLIGDKRTDRAFRGTVQGIIGAESLVCSRIAAFSPSAGDGEPQRRATGAADD
jgi:hypothetical protein